MTRTKSETKSTATGLKQDANTQKVQKNADFSKDNTKHEQIFKQETDRHTDRQTDGQADRQTDDNENCQLTGVTDWCWRLLSVLKNETENGRVEGVSFSSGAAVVIESSRLFVLLNSIIPNSVDSGFSFAPMERFPV